ncbi:hypothetical protein HKX48_008933 [Thoreauomyces humboldtii]|nr:hypothetical protein HKX48_008933 [Thoreauomyces humboldtii]
MSAASITRSVLSRMRVSSRSASTWSSWATKEECFHPKAPSSKRPSSASSSTTSASSDRDHDDDDHLHHRERTIFDDVDLTLNRKGRVHMEFERSREHATNVDEARMDAKSH